MHTMHYGLVSVNDKKSYLILTSKLLDADREREKKSMDANRYRAVI